MTRARRIRVLRKGSNTQVGMMILSSLASKVGENGRRDLLLWWRWGHSLRRENYPGSGDFSDEVLWRYELRYSIIHLHFLSLVYCVVFLFYAPEYQYSLCSALLIYIIQLLFNNLCYYHKCCMVAQELSKTTTELEPKVEVSGNCHPISRDT